MSMKKLFEEQMREQRLEIARQTLKKVFQAGIPAKHTVDEVLEELREDEALWDAFRSLRFIELVEMLIPPGSAAPPPGPSRKRGVTAKRIVDFVRANAGARRSDIMKALGLKGGTVSSQLRTLRSSGILRGEGEERNLSYFAD